MQLDDVRRFAWRQRAPEMDRRAGTATCRIRSSEPRRSSVPYDLEAGARLMEHGFARVYVRHFLKTLMVKTIRKLELYPDLCDIRKLRAARTFFEFDDALTGPVHGFVWRPRLLPAIELHSVSPARQYADATDECVERSVPSAVGLGRCAGDREAQPSTVHRVPAWRRACRVRVAGSPGHNGISWNAESSTGLPPASSHAITEA